MVNLLAAVVLLPIALLLVGVLGGVAITAIFNVSTTGWDTATVTVWNLLPIIAIIAIFLAFLAVVGLKITGKI